MIAADIPVRYPRYDWRTLQRRVHVEGESSLSDVEVLALLVGGRSAMLVSRALLDEYKTVAAVVALHPACLVRKAGIGPITAARISAAGGLMRRARIAPTPCKIQTSEEAWRFLAPRLAHQREEHFAVTYLAARGVVIAFEVLTKGNDAFTIVCPRQILRRAVENGARAIVMAHNHPSGDPDPSAADLTCTRVVAKACEVLGVILLDHIVIGAGRYVSLAEMGALPPWIGPALTTTSA